MVAKAKANITTSWVKETAPRDTKPRVLWGNLVYAQALISFLSLRSQEETRPQVIWENMTPGSSKTKIVETEECFCGNKEYTM